MAIRKGEAGGSDPPRQRISKAAGGKPPAPNKVKAKEPQRRGEGKGRILAAALDLFSEKGFDAVSTTDIAQRAASSQSVVLYHFSTKEELWREAMRSLFASVTVSPRFDEAMFKDLDPLSRLRILLRSFVHVSARHPELGRVVNREASSGSDRLVWLVEQLARPNYAVFERLFKECIECGVVKDYPPMVLTLMAHGAAATVFNLASVYKMLVGTDPLTPEAVGLQADLVVDVLLNGLAVRPE